MVVLVLVLLVLLPVGEEKIIVMLDLEKVSQPFLDNASTPFQ